MKNKKRQLLATKYEGRFWHNNVPWIPTAHEKAPPGTLPLWGRIDSDNVLWLSKSSQLDLMKVNNKRLKKS